MKTNKANSEPPDLDGVSSNRALREEIERLRAEVPYTFKGSTASKCQGTANTSQEVDFEFIQ